MDSSSSSSSAPAERSEILPRLIVDDIKRTEYKRRSLQELFDWPVPEGPDDGKQSEIIGDVKQRFFWFKRLVAETITIFCAHANCHANVEEWKPELMPSEERLAALYLVLLSGANSQNAAARWKSLALSMQQRVWVYACCGSNEGGCGVSDETDRYLQETEQYVDLVSSLITTVRGKLPHEDVDSDTLERFESIQDETTWMLVSLVHSAGLVWVGSPMITVMDILPVSSAFLRSNEDLSDFCKQISTQNALEYPSVLESFFKFLMKMANPPTADKDSQTIEEKKEDEEQMKE